MATSGSSSDRGSSDARAGAKVRRRAGVAIAGLVGAVVGLAFWQPAGLLLWIKAIHIIAVISWMAGLLYLPRLFIYHTDAAAGSDASETFKVMEHRLLTVIMRPAMVVSWLLGLWLAHASFGFSGWWLWLKIGAVVGLTGAHVAFASAVKAFAKDERRHTTRHWRLMNEVPTVLMIIIVILVVVKPF